MMKVAMFSRLTTRIRIMFIGSELSHVDSEPFSFIVKAK